MTKWSFSDSADIVNTALKVERFTPTVLRIYNFSSNEATATFTILTVEQDKWSRRSPSWKRNKWPGYIRRIFASSGFFPSDTNADYKRWSPAKHIRPSENFLGDRESVGVCIAWVGVCQFRFVGIDSFCEGNWICVLISWWMCYKCACENDNLWTYVSFVYILWVLCI